MKPGIVQVVAIVAICAAEAEAQRPRATASDGEVASAPELRRDPSRFAPAIPGVADDVRRRLRVDGDSAQAIALDDFAWKGRVSSVEIDEQDSRLFWDVKIIPDSTRGTLVRYRVDAVTGGILDIREFKGIRGLSRKPRA